MKQNYIKNIHYATKRKKLFESSVTKHFLTALLITV